MNVKGRDGKVDGDRREEEEEVEDRVEDNDAVGEEDDGLLSGVVRRTIQHLPVCRTSGSASFGNVESAILTFSILESVNSVLAKCTWMDVEVSGDILVEEDVVFSERGSVPWIH